MKHARDSSTTVLRRFTAHGFVVARETDTQLVGNCVFCGKEGHLYVAKETGLYHCKRCDAKGNPPQFFAQVQSDVYRPALTTALLAALAENRGLPVAAFEGWDFGYNDAHDCYTLLIKDHSGTAVDLRTWKDGVGFRSTAGCSVGLFGLHYLALHDGEPVHLCEGEWDAVALDWLHRSLGKPGAVLGVPGAGTFKKAWAQHFAGREVSVWYDHDDAGRQGELAVRKALLGVAASVKFVHWPDDLPVGFDVRDHVVEFAVRAKKPARCLKQLLALRQPQPRLGLVEGAAPANVTPTTNSQPEFDQRLLALSDEADKIAHLNTRHFTIQLGRMMVVGVERPGKQTTFLPYPQFTSRYRHHFIPSATGKGATLGKRYLDSPLHLHFDGQLVCKPPGVAEPAGPDDKNLWPGFAVEPKPGDWSRLTAHIRENLCGGNATIYEYVLNWLALLVQWPGRLPGTAICLRGEPGTGKSIFVKFIERLFYPESVATVTKPDQIVGNFNAILSGRVLVFADEAFFAGDPTRRGALHALITERTNAIERKGLDTVVEDNCVHLIIASNEDWFVGVGEHDRRFLVLDVSTAHRQDLPYFEAMRRQQEDEGGTAAMLHELKARDLTSFKPATLPWTAAKQDQVNLSRKGFDLWWHHVLTDATPESWQDQSPLKSRWYQKYLSYADSVKDRHPQGAQFLSRFLVKHYGNGVIGRRRVDKKQEHVYRLPPLVEARQKFDPRENWSNDLPATALTVVVRRPRRRR